jgi:hypothetical protein
LDKQKLSDDDDLPIREPIDGALRHLDDVLIAVM